jgi:hypothetical protein
MNAEDFRRIALSLDGAEEGSHMGARDFRVGGRIFATLAAASQGFGNLMLTPEKQAQYVAEQPELFLPVKGGWGRMGITHIRLAHVDEDVLHGALHTAWRLRLEKNHQVRTKTGSGASRAVAREGESERVRLARIRKAELRKQLTSPAALESVKRRYGLDD